MHKESIQRYRIPKALVIKMVSWNVRGSDDIKIPSSRSLIVDLVVMPGGSRKVPQQCDKVTYSWICSESCRSLQTSELEPRSKTLLGSRCGREVQRGWFSLQSSSQLLTLSKHIADFECDGMSALILIQPHQRLLWKPMMVNTVFKDVFKPSETYLAAIAAPWTIVRRVLFGSAWWKRNWCYHEAKSSMPFYETRRWGTKTYD